MKSYLITVFFCLLPLCPVAAAVVPDSCLNTTDTLSVWYIDAPRLELISNTLTDPDNPENIRQVILDDQTVLISEHGIDEVSAEVLGIVCRIEHRGGGLRQGFYFDVKQGTSQDLLQAIMNDLLQSRHYKRIRWLHPNWPKHHQKR